MVDGRSKNAHKKALQNGHLHQGWCDLGYHYGIGKSGTILDGRSTRYEGAHVSGHNGYTVGVMLHGDYTCMPRYEYH